MFSGVGPYPIVVAKILKRNGIKAKIFSNELNEKANYYEKKNIILNKLTDYVFQICGDARKIPKMTKEKFDVVLMPRPNIEETFLKTAIRVSKKGARIFYHGFGVEEKVIEEIRKDAGKKIGKIEIRKAGDIGPNIYRWQASFKVL
jgi:tRNA G37 N-methylase Trm5